MRILLCLLSEQHVPNLLSVHHFQPDRLVLVETGAMRQRKAADHLLAALRLGGRDYTDRHEIQPVDQGDCLSELRPALKTAFGLHPADEWIVNVTGGTKPMSISAYQIFTPLEATLVYISSREPNVIRWLDGSRSEACNHRPSIAEFLAGYGFESRKTPDKVTGAEERARGWWECARALASHALPEDLIRFGSEEDPDRAQKRAREQGIVLKEQHLNPSWLASEPDRLALERTFGLTGSIDKYQARFLTGEWLEAFLWGLLDRHQGPLGLWDVRLGLEPARCGDQTGNDFDVAFMKDYGLWMIECKTGGQENDPGGEIFYKVEAVVRQFHALHVRTVLATTSDFLLDPRTGQIKTALRNRSEIYRCAIADRGRIRELASGETPLDALETFLRS